MTTARARMLHACLVVAAAAGLGLFAFMTWASFTIGPSEATGGVYQVDWHVYWVGAHDLITRDLYRVPLDAGNLPLSAPAFKLPPLSAAWALPLLGFPIEVGGVIWQLLAAASVVFATAVALDIAGTQKPWLWAGLVLGPLSLTLVYLEGLHLGTNNYLVLALVAGGVWAYLRGRDSAAGVLIGLAIATKLWPATLLVVVGRERRWTVMMWALGTTLIQGIVLFGWLGPDIIEPFIATMQTEIPATGLLIGPTGWTGLRDVWNAGLGAVIAIGLLLIPLRGAAALGVAILAGLALIANLWIHYAPTIMFAIALLLAPAVRPRARARAVQP